MINPYNLDEAKDQVSQRKLMVEIMIGIETLKNLMIQKGVIDEYAYDACRKYVETTEPYKSYLMTLQVTSERIQQYQKDPQQHLRDIMKAKLDGTLK